MKSSQQTRVIVYTLQMGRPLKIYGTILLKLQFDPSGTFDWNFLVADVQKAILGADFLQAHDLVVGVKRKLLLGSRQLWDRAVHTSISKEPNSLLIRPTTINSSANVFDRLLSDTYSSLLLPFQFQEIMQADKHSLFDRFYREARTAQKV